MKRLLKWLGFYKADPMLEQGVMTVISGAHRDSLTAKALALSAASKKMYVRADWNKLQTWSARAWMMRKNPLVVIVENAPADYDKLRWLMVTTEVANVMPPILVFCVLGSPTVPKGVQLIKVEKDQS